MNKDALIIVDSPDTGDVTPGDLHLLVEQLRDELPDSEVHAAWEEQSAAHAGDYWPEVILWVVGDKDLVDTTVRIVLITKATEAILRRMGKLCIKFARFTKGNTGMVFKKLFIESGEEPIEENVSENEQETVRRSHLRD